MVNLPKNSSGAGLVSPKAIRNDRFLRSCPPRSPIAKSQTPVYLLNMTRGQRIVRALLSKGVKKSEIARHCAVDYKTVIAWANEWWHPSLENVHKLQVLYIKHQNFPFGQMELNLEDYTR